MSNHRSSQRTQSPPQIPETPPETPKTPELPITPLGLPEPLIPLVNNGVLVRASQLPVLSMATPLSECPTNLDKSIPRERALIFDCGNPDDFEFDSNRQLIITAYHWLAYPDERTDEKTGEVSEFVRIVLFDQDGRFFKTTSAFAPRRLKAAIELYTPEDWKQGVTFIIRERPSKRHPGGSYHDIRILVEGNAVKTEG